MSSAVPSAIPPGSARGDLHAGLRALGRGCIGKLDDAIGEKIILLVSDINMPGMSGLDLLPDGEGASSRLPVFMISAYGDAERVATALARGADGFLTKPVDFPKLKQDIMAAITDATEGNG